MAGKDIRDRIARRYVRRLSCDANSRKKALGLL